MSCVKTTPLHSRFFPRPLGSALGVRRRESSHPSKLAASSPLPPQNNNAGEDQVRGLDVQVMPQNAEAQKNLSTVFLPML